MDDLDQILTSWSWIKVRKYVEDPTLTWEERYKALEKHHQAETTFLIEKVRQLAALLKERGE